MFMRTIISLCDYTGNWSAPYVDAGYQVVRVDLAHGQDVRLLKFPGHVHGVLAAPPCTVFSIAGAHIERTEQEWIDALSIADACLRIVAVTKPAWWALENPASSRISKWIGPASWTFEPWHYGDAYTKRTAIWGTAKKPDRTVPVMPKFTPGTRYGKAVMRDWTTSQASGRTRSETPMGFARAFFEANP